MSGIWGRTVRMTTAVAMTAALFGAGVPATAATSTAVAKSSHKADVDGDGRADTVTVAPASGQRLRVSVRTAKGRAASILIDQRDFGPSVSDKPYYGAADFDGVAGQELFVFYGQGAHTPWFKVLTWRDGKLFATRDPFSGEASWAPDSCVGYGTGYTVTGKGANKKLTVTQAVFDAASSKYRGTDTTYAWSTAKGRWVKKATAKTSFSTKAWKDHFGWHVKGLAVLPYV